jgi:hypothetical protein
MARPKKDRNKCLFVRCDIHTHIRVKRAASKLNITVNDFALDAIIAMLQKEENENRSPSTDRREEPSTDCGSIYRSQPLPRISDEPYNPFDRARETLRRAKRGDESGPATDNDQKS